MEAQKIFKRYEYKYLLNLEQLAALNDRRCLWQKHHLQPVF